MTSPTHGTPHDLVAGEGVDEGSAASTAEGDLSGATDVVGEPMHGAPDPVTEAGPPVGDVPDDTPGPGQRLSEGEG